jgi:hypothetical protein
MLSASDN